MCDTLQFARSELGTLPLPGGGRGAVSGKCLSIGLSPLTRLASLCSQVDLSPPGERSSKRRALADQRPPSLQRRQRAHPGDERVEIRLGELAEVDVARHRRLEGAAVASDPLRERALGLLVARLAGAGGRMGACG